MNQCCCIIVNQPLLLSDVLGFPLFLYSFQHPIPEDTWGLITLSPYTPPARDHFSDFPFFNDLGSLEDYWSFVERYSIGITLTFVLWWWRARGFWRGCPEINTTWPPHVRESLCPHVHRLLRLTVGLDDRCWSDLPAVVRYHEMPEATKPNTLRWMECLRNFAVHNLGNPTASLDWQPHRHTFLV